MSTKLADAIQQKIDTLANQRDETIKKLADIDRQLQALSDANRLFNANPKIQDILDTLGITLSS